jgi:hypothetical protein
VCAARVKWCSSAGVRLDVRAVATLFFFSFELAYLALKRICFFSLTLQSIPSAYAVNQHKGRVRKDRNTLPLRFIDFLMVLLENGAHEGKIEVYLDFEIALSQRIGQQ